MTGYDATALAERMQALASEHPWMDSSTAATVASQPMSNDTMLKVAEQIRQQAADSYNGYTPFSYDPAQHQPSSTRAFMQSYINTVYGQNPFDAQSLTTMQQGLQKAGYGKGLATDGAWTRDWQDALRANTHDAYEQMLAGKRPLSTTSHGLLHSVLSALAPSGIASAAVGMVKSLPGDFRNLSADLLGDVTTLGGSLTYGLEQAVTGHGAEGIRASLRAGAGVGAGINNALGGQHLSAEEYYNQRQHLSRLVNDLGTILLVTPGVGEALGAGVKGLTGLGKATELAEAQAGQGVIVSSLGRTVGHEAAVRGPGMTAKVVASRAGKRIITGAAVGGATGGIGAAVQGQDIAHGITEGAMVGGAFGGASRLVERVGGATGALPKNALDNLPVLRQAGPLIDSLASKDGMYYALRNRLAKPYEYGAVRVAGQAYQKAQFGSLKVHGLAWLENSVGDDPNTQPLARAVAGSHPLDPIDHAMAAAAEKLHLPFSPKVDWLMYVLHGDLNAGLGREPGESAGLTGDVARKVQAYHDTVDAALGTTGHMERIIRGTGRSYDQLLADADGNKDILNRWALDKVNHAAASVYADEVLRKLPKEQQALVVSDHQQLTRFLTTARDEAMGNNETLQSAHELLALPRYHNYLETYIRKELVASKTQPGESLRNSIADYVRAGQTLSDEVLPRISRDFLTPQEVEFLPKGVHDAKVRKAMSEHGLSWRGVQARKGEVGEGSIGLLRQGKLTSQQAERDLQGFGSRAKDLFAEREALAVGKRSLTGDQAEARAALGEEERSRRIAANGAKLDDLYSEMLDYAYNEFGITRRPLAVYKGQDAKQGVNKVLSLLEDARKDLASEVFLAPDASPEARAAYASIRDRGYLVVHGKDIGHSYRGDIPHVADLGELATKQRHVATALGLNTERFSHTDVANAARLKMATRLEAAAAKGRITFGQHGTARDVLNDLTDENLLAGQDLSWAQKMAFSAAAPFHKRAINKIAEAFDETPIQAEARLKSDLALAGGIRGLSRKTAVKILTRNDADGVPIMDEVSANRIYNEVMAAQAELPAYMVGLTKIEDLARFGAFRYASNKGWDLDNMRAVLALPNALARARDNWRFSMNPLFSVRRVVKTNLKMVMDNVEASHNPVRWMTERNAFGDAHSLLDRIEGNQKGFYDYKDEAERYLDQHDVWGIYDPRAYKAMYAYQKQQQGFSEEEIRQGLNRVFDYGGRGEQGRTALERSTNVVFFPFSFEKTLLRSVGGYLMDHQAQALVLSQALDAYRQFSAAHPNDPLTKDWLERHAPVLEEALKLNAFAHGISPGELGGINRPVLNAFMPQSWATHKDSVRTLTRFVPAVNDLHRIMGEINAQQTDVRTSVANGFAHLERHGGNALFRLPSGEVKQAQIGDALHFRAELLDAFSKVIDYNDSQGDDNAKYHFGFSDKIPVELRGQVIDRSTISKIVQHAYPAWDPQVGINMAIKSKADAQTFVNSQHGKPDYERYQTFLTTAETAIGHMNKDDYPVEQLGAVQQAFRTEAADLVARNKKFRKVYDKTFASYFGPLQ